MADKGLDFEEYDSLFSYDAKTGTLTNKIRRSTRALEGKPATAKGSGGRLVVRHKGKSIEAPRIAWLLSTGKDPGENGVKYIDGDQTNLKSCNLVLTNKADNLAIKEVAGKLKDEEKKEQEVKKAKADQEQQVSGEVTRTKNGKWMVRVSDGGGIKIVGYFETEQLANNALEQAVVRFN